MLGFRAVDTVWGRFRLRLVPALLMGTGVILLATPRPGVAVRDVTETEFHHSSPAVRYEGDWDRCTLHGPLTAARATSPASRMTLTFEGDGVILFFWSDPWCSRVRIRIDGATTTRAVYSPVGGFMQVRRLDLPAGTHTLELSSDDAVEPGAQGRNLMFWKAIGVTRRPHARA